MHGRPSSLVEFGAFRAGVHSGDASSDQMFPDVADSLGYLPKDHPLSLEPRAYFPAFGLESDPTPTWRP